MDQRPPVSDLKGKSARVSFLLKVIPNHQNRLPWQKSLDLCTKDRTALRHVVGSGVEDHSRINIRTGMIRAVGAGTKNVDAPNSGDTSERTLQVLDRSRNMLFGWSMTLNPVRKDSHKHVREKVFEPQIKAPQGRCAPGRGATG
jgi:hypothetical protein